MHFSDARSRNAIFVAVVIVAIVFGWLALEIPKGILSSSGDEMLTAERSREMLLLGRLEVHFNLAPSFQKPPLQYWLTSLTLPRLENPSLAVRIWPWFYGIVTAIAVAWLAFILEPNRLWVVALSVAIVTSFPLFATEASRGLLDTGLAFFATLAIGFAHLARKRPVWWAGVAIACGLGSLQKIPIPFLLWLFILAVRSISATDRKQLKSTWLFVSLPAAILAMAIWPVTQLLRHDVPFQELYNEEVVDWLGPHNLGANPYLEIPYRLITTSAGGFFLLLAPLTILIWRKGGFSRPASEISIICLALIASETVFGFRHVRYIESIIPAMCLLLAMVLHRLLERGRALQVAACTLIVVFVLAGLSQTKLQLDYRRRKDFSDEKRVAEELGTLQKEGVRTILIKAIEVGSDLHFASFYLFHGNLRFPVEKYSVEEIQQSPPPPPVIGACVARDFPAVQAVYPNAKVQFTRAQFIIWSVGDST